MIDLINKGEDLRIQNMLESLPVGTAGEDEIKKWYNLPHDAHPSDLGCQIYARAVHDKIRERLTEAKPQGVTTPVAGIPSGSNP